MIEEIKNITHEEYLETFKKKFQNFAYKAPCKIDIVITPISIIVKDKRTLKTATFNFDYSIAINDFIFEIKQWLLENVYPVMIEKIVTNEEYTDDELREFANNNVDVDEILLSKKTKIIENHYKQNPKKNS